MKFGLLSRRHLFLLGLLVSCGPQVENQSVMIEAEATCELYCAAITRHCQRASQQYPSIAVCLTTCAGFAHQASRERPEGDTFNCRLFYALAARQSAERRAFCLNAGPSGGFTCVDGP